jgi:uncharacterized protein (DUF362 family)
MKKRKKLFRLILTVVLITTWSIWDFSQSHKGLTALYKSYKYESEFDAVSSATTKVSIMRSDDTTLFDPIPVNDPSLDYEQIEEMVRQAIKLAGGLYMVHPGDMVLIKPNIVDADPPGCGEETDPRVVKAIVKIVDEVDPGNMEIVVGEGSPVPINYEMEYNEYYDHVFWGKLWDKTGYQDLLTDSYLDGINLRFSNLNCHMPGPDWEDGDPWPTDSAWIDLALVEVPGGGQALPQNGKYWIHKDVLNADVFITVPVMKIHTPGMTCALKNQIGLAPSTVYGFWKQMGVPQNNYEYRLVHEKLAPKWWTDKEIVDLDLITGIDFCIVDATMCLDRAKDLYYNNSNQVRMNMIVAGADPVAVDNVCTRLMGMNPDDVEHITLAERVGLGTNDPDKIHIKGADLEKTKKRFRKSYFGGGEFGQGNRVWLLKGPFGTNGVDNPIDHEFITNEKDLAPEPEKDGWSESVYFTDNRIDLKDYFHLESGAQVAGYAFCYFDAPQTQQAELWIGSDEALKIILNGTEVYKYNGTRSFPGDGFTSEKKTVMIQAGENRLLIKTLQKYSYYQFCINICEPESDPDYDGNRVFGLKFKTISGTTGIHDHPNRLTENQFNLKAFPNPFRFMITLEYELPHNGMVRLDLYNMAGQAIRTLTYQHQGAGKHELSWDGRDQFGGEMPVGMYIYELSFDGKKEQGKLFKIR